MRSTLKRRPPLSSTVARASAAVAVALGLLIAAPLSAQAEEPVAFGASDLHDSAEALGGERARVSAAMDSLFDETGIQLLVAYVDSFDGAASPSAWAEATAERNGLGSNDVLLAVATDDRNYVTWYPSDFELSESATLSVERDDIEPQLRENDWAGAAIAAAEGYERESAGTNWWPIIGIIAAAALLWWGIATLRRRKNASAQQRVATARLEELEKRASLALVALDDEIMTGREELAFAAAQFGAEATEPFRSALEAARAKSMEAFELKHRLDDTEDEPDAERAAMAEQILTLTAEGDSTLEAQAAAFAELRELEQRAPEALAAASEALDQLATRVPASEKLMADLGARYAPLALSAVTENTRQAHEILAFAAEASEAARAAIATAEPSVAAVKVRAMQASADRVTQLLDAIDAIANDLADASARLTAALRDTREDLDAAESLRGDARVVNAAEALSRAMAAAAGAIDAAAAPEGVADPVRSIAALVEADAGLDRVLAAARDEQERTARATVALPDAMSRAQQAVAQASSFIATRRGGVREFARTRLAEAERLLDAAAVASSSDPVSAVDVAVRAATSARQALEAAQSDVRAASAHRDGSTGDGAALAGLLGDLFFGQSTSRLSTWSGSSGSWGGSSRSGSSRTTSRSGSRSRSSSSSRSRSSSSRRSGGSRGRTGGGRF